MKKINYNIGLDIGTSSIGYAVINNDNKLLKLRRKTAIGAYLFAEGQTAAERRSKRAARRRLRRRKWRLGLLEETFAPAMKNVDEQFFSRMKASELSPKDKRKQYGTIIFPDKKSEQAFYKKYPTIFHLRYALMTDKTQHDLREVYVALHNIVKYRGNFLNNSPVENFVASKLELPLAEINVCLSQLFADKNDEFGQAVQLNADVAPEAANILLNAAASKQDKKIQLIDLLTVTVTDKKLAKLNKDVITQIVYWLLGHNVDVHKLVNQETKLPFEPSTADDDKLAALLAELDDTAQELVNLLEKQRRAIVLAQFVPSGKTLSEAMIAKYEQHRRDFALLRDVANSLFALDDEAANKDAKKLRAEYDFYIKSHHYNLVEAKKLLGVTRTKEKDRKPFNEQVKNLIGKYQGKVPLADELYQAAGTEGFMPKQRTGENGIIPHQLHQIELEKIIENQGKYYPFLRATYTDKDGKERNKIAALVSFRVPYYVGPLVDNEQISAKTQKNPFAWAKRKEAGRITPWNFDEKIDRAASANRFIQRMTTTDTYLYGEDVLPDSSLLYEEFKVYDELNKVRVNGKPLKREDKQGVIDNLFKKYKTVTVRRMRDYLKQQETYMYDESLKVEGLSDPKKFNNGMKTFIDYNKIFGAKLEDRTYLADFEKMIKWATVFEDRTIFQAKLKNIKWLTPEERQQVSRLRYKGWGKLSYKLLMGLVDSNGQNLLQVMHDTPTTLISFISRPEIKEQIENYNQDLLKTGTEDILAEAYTSPQNKKAIRQVERLVADIVKAAGETQPEKIALEFPRGGGQAGKMTTSRVKHLKELYKQNKEIIAEYNSNISKELKRENNSGHLSDRLYLYYTQMGRDIYTGKPLNIDNITNYDIDHIIPQSYIKDDSLDNRVLVEKAVNASAKSDNVPLNLFGDKLLAGSGMKVKRFWQLLRDHNLISKRKLNNLLTNPNKVDKYKYEGFINRQLVETRQVIKLVTTILQEKYPDTEIIVVKASINSQLRNQLGIPKLRVLNDYHHAVDAYLTAFAGNYLYRVYPKLRRYFVYGQYKKFNDDGAKNLKYNLTAFFAALSNNKLDKITTPEGEEVFDREEQIKEIKRVANFKYMNMVYKPEFRSGKLFDDTVYPILERDERATRKLIPRRKDLPVEFYGGYSSDKVCYLALAKLTKKQGEEYKVLAIPRRFKHKIEASPNPKEAIFELFGEALLAKRGVKQVEIIKTKLPCLQLVQDNKSKYLMSSDIEKKSTQQLVLPIWQQKLLGQYLPLVDKIYVDDNNKDLGGQLNDIYMCVKKEISLWGLYNVRSNRKNSKNVYEKLDESTPKFEMLNNSDKLDVIYKLLQGLHANASGKEITQLNIKDLGRFQARNGITLSPEAQLIYQSPSGLFERRVRVSDL